MLMKEMLSNRNHGAPKIVGIPVKNSVSKFFPFFSPSKVGKINFPNSTHTIYRIFFESDAVLSILNQTGEKFHRWIGKIILFQIIGTITGYYTQNNSKKIKKYKKQHIKQQKCSFTVFPS